MLSGKTFTFPTDVTIFQKCFLHISQNYFQNQFMNVMRELLSELGPLAFLPLKVLHKSIYLFTKHCSK